VMSLKNLSDDNLLEGMKKSYANAVELLDEAHLLFNSKKYSRAYSLCQLSIEEFAKAPLLFGVLMERLEGLEIDYEKYDHDFKNHEKKMEHGIEWEIAMFKKFKHDTGKDFIDKTMEKSEEFLTKIKEFNNLDRKSTRLNSSHVK